MGIVARKDTWTMPIIDRWTDLSDTFTILGEVGRLVQVWIINKAITKGEILNIVGVDTTMKHG